MTPENLWEVGSFKKKQKTFYPYIALYLSVFILRFLFFLTMLEFRIGIWHGHRHYIFAALKCPKMSAEKGG